MTELKGKKRKILISVTIVVLIVAFVGSSIHYVNVKRVKIQSESEVSNPQEVDHEQTIMEVDKQSNLETEIADHLQDNIIAEKVEIDPVSDMYQQYYDKLIELQDRYGLCETVIEDANDPFLEQNCYLKGLCFARLLDFDIDGTDDLILAYHVGQASDNTFFQNYRIEIWAYQESVIQKVYSGEAVKEGEGSLSIHLSLVDEKYFLYNYMEEFDEETYEACYIDEWRGFNGETVDVLKRDVCKAGEIETYSIDDRDVTEEEWKEDREKWTDLDGDYGLQNGGNTMDASVSELAGTFKTLSEYLEIAWVDNISQKKEEKPYADSAWGTELIGYWETLLVESYGEWAALTIYEDGIAELQTRSGACFGTFEIQSDGSIMLNLSDEYLYDNSVAQWFHAENNMQIQLTMGGNMYEMNYAYVGGMREGSFPYSAVLNRVVEDGADYSSAEEVVQYYERKVTQ